MTRFRFIVPFLLAVIICLPACAQSADNTREQRILENLKFEFSQLREYEVTVQRLEDSGIAGLKIGSFLIAGQQQQQFLVTDDEQMFLIAAGPIDVGRTAAELQELQNQEEQAELEEAQQRDEMLDSFIQGRPVRGNPDAPVTIVEFSDFQCPFCLRAYPTIEALLDQRDDIKLVYAHFPLSNHPWAQPAAVAAICAEQQSHDAFWTLHDAFFDNQREISTSNVVQKSRSFLEDTGIDLEQWATCTEHSDVDTHRLAESQLSESMQLGQQFGITGTPAFFINGHMLSGAKPIEEFNEAIEQVLRSR